MFSKPSTCFPKSTWDGHFGCTPYVLPPTSSFVDSLYSAHLQSLENGTLEFRSIDLHQCSLSELALKFGPRNENPRLLPHRHPPRQTFSQWFRLPLQLAIHPLKPKAQWVVSYYRGNWDPRLRWSSSDTSNSGSGLPIADHFNMNRYNNPIPADLGARHLYTETTDSLTQLQTHPPMHSPGEWKTLSLKGSIPLAPCESEGEPLKSQRHFGGASQPQWEDGSPIRGAWSARCGTPQAAVPAETGARRAWRGRRQTLGSKQLEGEKASLGATNWFFPLKYLTAFFCLKTWVMIRVVACSETKGSHVIMGATCQ